MADVDCDGSFTLIASKSMSDGISNGSSSIKFNGSKSDGTNVGSMIATHDVDDDGGGGSGNINWSENMSNASVSVIQSPMKLYDDTFESFELVNISFDEISSASSFVSHGMREKTASVELDASARLTNVSLGATAVVVSSAKVVAATAVIIDVAISDEPTDFALSPSTLFEPVGA